MKVELINERRDGIKLFRISNEFISIEVINKGCRLMSITTQDKHQQKSNIILGLQYIEDCDDDSTYMGAVIGRVANRIQNANFELEGKTYQLETNNGPNTLHGGKVGFDKKLFDSMILDNGILFTYYSKDMESGFPGNVDFKVKYTLEDNKFDIEYEAITDKTTIVNFTNHMYFNLGTTSSIKQHELMIKASKVGLTDPDCLATGEFMDVFNTPFDFNEFKVIEEGLNTKHPQIISAKGYDHPFVLDTGNESIILKDSISGRKLTISTDMPTVQVYTGNYLNDGPVGLKGRKYEDYEGIALETQLMPDSIHNEEQPSCILKAGDVFKSKTTYQFDILV